MGNRALTEKFIMGFYADIDPSGYNTEIMTKVFKNMSDSEFDRYMKDIRDGLKFLVIFKPLYKANGISTKNNLKIATKYNLKFFEKLTYTNGGKNSIDYTTPIEYLVVDMPYRRQSQTLVKKVSIPDNNKVIDELTFQPTGESKGSKISYPELQVLIGMGLDNTISELIRFRGGDRNGFNAYNAMFMRYGSANLKTLENYSTGVESTKSLRVYLTGMHISNTI